jgi:hypothetical protein
MVVSLTAVFIVFPPFRLLLISNYKLNHNLTMFVSVVKLNRFTLTASPGCFKGDAAFTERTVFGLIVVNRFTEGAEQRKGELDAGAAVDEHADTDDLRTGGKYCAYRFVN